jgi:hypothetical protein
VDPERAVTQAMLRSAGFCIEGRRGSDIYICRSTAPDPGSELPSNIRDSPAPSG